MGKKKGTALIIVLVFSMVMLTFGLAYLKSISSSSTVNPIQHYNSQLDLLAAGLANIALLKYKELPSDFYYSYFIAKVATNCTRVSDPLNVYQNDPLLKGTLPDPNDPGQIASFATFFQVLSQNKYATDTIQITTIIEFPSRGITRELKRTISTARRRL